MEHAAHDTRSDDVALRVDRCGPRKRSARQINRAELPSAQQIAITCSSRIPVGADNVGTRVTSQRICQRRARDVKGRDDALVQQITMTHTIEVRAHGVPGSVDSTRIRKNRARGVDVAEVAIAEHKTVSSGGATWRGADDSRPDLKEAQVKVNRITLVSVVAVVLAVTYPRVSRVDAQDLRPQQLTTNQEQVVKRDVQAAFDRYYGWFSAGHSDLIADKAFLTPSLFLRPTELEVISSSEALRAHYAAQLKPLIADGYVKSEMPKPTICVLNERTAMISGRYVRYRKDGAVMGEFGGTYIFAKVSDDWRIVSVITHAPSKIVQCSN